MALAKPFALGWQIALQTLFARILHEFGPKSSPLSIDRSTKKLLAASPTEAFRSRPFAFARPAEVIRPIRLNGSDLSSNRIAVKIDQAAQKLRVMAFAKPSDNLSSLAAFDAAKVFRVANLRLEPLASLIDHPCLVGDVMLLTKPKRFVRSTALIDLAELLGAIGKRLEDIEVEIDIPALHPLAMPIAQPKPLNPLDQTTRKPTPLCRSQNSLQLGKS